MLHFAYDTVATYNKGNISYETLQRLGIKLRQNNKIYAIDQERKRNCERVGKKWEKMARQQRSEVMKV
jgi:hypothetical protein